MAKKKVSKKYLHSVVEAKWTTEWEKYGTYRPTNFDKPKNKFYNLMMFPYPSAEGLHAGNMFAFTGSDIYGRFKRLQGYNVFEPIGLDGFGIHSENYAIKVGRSPQEHAKVSQKNFYSQLHSVGNGFDWSRTLETYDPDYYKWTQWLFAEMFKAGLAYRGVAEVNWCPSCRTVLADEQVVKSKDVGKTHHDVYSKTGDNSLGVCERCGTPVIRKKLEQWFFRITTYANRLLDNLSDINWPEKIKIAQTNWIGRKDGINISYSIEGSKLKISCFTTTPVNYAATFLILSPEHPIIKDITTNKYMKDITKYITNTKKKTKEDRIAEGREKTGVFTGAYAINHLTQKQMPIWVSDFAIMGVGTGAVQGCPGHDMRDFEFAKKFGLPIKRVIVGSDGDKSPVNKPKQVIQAGEEGKMINSEFLNGLNFDEAMQRTMDHFEAKAWGERVSTYHLRDWLISRQRYWGPPIPMIYCEHCAGSKKSYFTSTEAKKSKLLHKDQTDWEHFGWYPETKLPVVLPEIKDYLPKGTGRGPLADHPEFYNVSCPECGKDARRETDVSDTFLDSAWYFLRYPSVEAKTSKKLPFDPKITKDWLPVDLYFGGAEHSVLHLMYARFTTQVLFDLGHVSFEEPFPKFYAHGLVIKDGAKMSKSRGNVVNPDEYVKKYGADTLRLYLMFMGPMDGYPDFRDTGIEGMRRFIERVWSLFFTEATKKLTPEALSKIDVRMHQTIKKVTMDIEEFRYNTAVSSIMEYVNTLRSVGTTKESLIVLTQLLAPFTPFMSEEIWTEILGKKFSVHIGGWPKFDEDLASELEATIAVQVNGKLRGTLLVSKSTGLDKNEAIKTARQIKTVEKALKGKSVAKTIFIPGKIVNFVTK